MTLITIISTRFNHPKLCNCLKFFKNRFNYALGRKQEFDELLAARDISAIRSSMQTRGDVAIEALKEYETSLHAVNNREPKNHH